MLFNSLDFAVFLPIIFMIYWLIPKNQLRFQNLFLLIASYVFYGWWDWRFLSLIIFSSFVDYIVGLNLVKTDNQKRKKILLSVSILVNLGFLGFFKYFNFFADSFADAFTLFAVPFEATRLNIILPVGISFYTFQTMSYTIDIYKGNMNPTKSVVNFFAYVGFFPQLVAGPIERATNLLPQFSKAREFNYSDAVDGLRQILWGLFKKMVIADNAAVIVNLIFGNYQDYSGSTLLLGAILFAFQIYGDFSGYSDIAIGTAKLFGFNLMQNFAYPYFSRDIAEFWRRWHISLSSWFRDYLYIPLGGSRGGTWMKIRNTIIIFVVSGFWHGANWTFVIWGFLHALYFIPLLLMNKNRKHVSAIDTSKKLPGFRELLGIGFTFFLVVIAWVFFRADSVGTAFNYLAGIFNSSLFESPAINPAKVMIPIIVLIIVEWLNRNEKHGLNISILPKSTIPRWAGYAVLLFFILVYSGESQAFIYFQF